MSRGEPAREIRVKVEFGLDIPCTNCKGRGIKKKTKEDCRVCGGRGIVRKEMT